MPTATELRELDDEELESRLGEYRRELLNLRFQLATGQLDNHTRLAQVRKDVARVLTVLRDREIALAEGREAGPEVLTVPRRRPRPAFDSEGFQEDVEEEGRRRRDRRRRAEESDEAGEGPAGDEDEDISAEGGDAVGDEDVTAPDDGDEGDE